MALAGAARWRLDSRHPVRCRAREETLADLLMRNLGSIERRTLSLRTSDQISDAALLAALNPADSEGDEEPVREEVGPVVLLLSENYLSAVAAGRGRCSRLWARAVISEKYSNSNRISSRR